jgi:hypothetical protein
MKAMKKNTHQKVRVALCLTANEPDLELRKVYQVLPDEVAEQDNYVRVIDESGEDYLYPSSYFVFIEMPKEAERALLMAA